MAKRRKRNRKTIRTTKGIKRKFSNTANKVHPKNVNTKANRGGIRL